VTPGGDGGAAVNNRAIQPPGGRGGAAGPARPTAPERARPRTPTGSGGAARNPTPPRSPAPDPRNHAFDPKRPRTPPPKAAAAAVVVNPAVRPPPAAAVRAGRAARGPGPPSGSAAGGGAAPADRDPNRPRSPPLASDRMRAQALAAVDSRDVSPAHDIAAARDELAVSILEEEDERVRGGASHRQPRPRCRSCSISDAC